MVLSSARPAPPPTISSGPTPQAAGTPTPLPSVLPTATNRPAPTGSPALAPGGRTGDPLLDAHIHRLLAAGAAELNGLFPGVAAREQRCDLECRGSDLELQDWTSRLAGAERSLYAVFTGDESDVEIVIAVRSGGGPAEAWRFGIDDARLRDVRIFIDAPPSAAEGPLYAARIRSPSPASQFERFYVLPPQDELPRPPRMHPLSVRPGRPGVDALMATLEARDAVRLRAAFADPAAPPVRDCETIGPRVDRTYAATWAEVTARQLGGIHSVVDVPEGHQPRSDHLVIAFRQIKPYWWVATGILEREGRIVGVITGDWSCWPERLYPADRYLVPPPEGGLAGLDPARRSGIASIDAILDAAAARDEQAMASLIEYTPIACGDATGFPPHTGPPPCPSGAPAGTPVDVLPEVDCAPNQYLRDRAPKALIEWIAASSGLYAVVPSSGPSGSGFLVIVSPRSGAIGLSLGERGVRHVSLGCGPYHPDALATGRRPSFLLPPP